MASGDILKRYATSVSLGITIDTNLADNDGQISPKITNDALYDAIRIQGNIRANLTPTAGNTILFYLLQQDRVTSPNVTTEGYTLANAGTTTQPSFTPVEHTVIVPSSPTSNMDLYFDFVIESPGPWWALLIWNKMGVTANASGHNIYYTGEYAHVEA